jgi:hypothetical protein
MCPMYVVLRYPPPQQSDSPSVDLTNGMAEAANTIPYCPNIVD